MSYSPTPDEPPVERGWWLMFVLPTLVVALSLIFKACG